ncbi:MAG: hypothetical protein N3A72_01070 [bacterium]|nr:hypothetical protein [bacterium]
MKNIIVVILVLLCAIPGYAIIGTQLLQNTGFENPISLDTIVRYRTQLGQWGLGAFAPNSEGIYQTDTLYFAGNKAVCISRRTDGRAISQWADVSPYSGKNRVHMGCWVCIPNVYAAQGWYAGTGRTGYISNTFSTGTGDDLHVGAYSAGTGPYAALATWQPFFGWPLWIPDTCVNFRTSFYLDYRAGATDDIDNHFIDEYKAWVDDQVTEYKAINFGSPVIALDTAPAKDDDMERGHPWVIKDGDLYKMWYTGRAQDSVFRICYAESTNGIDWLRFGAVYAFNDHTADGYYYDTTRIWIPCVLKEVDGVTTTYKMWYTGLGLWKDRGTPANRICYATSPDGTTNWTRYGPVLGVDTGTKFTMNEGSAMCPRVIKVGNTYKMWFCDDGGTKIGYSESTDGINWSKPYQVMRTSTMTSDTTQYDSFRLWLPGPYYDADAEVYHLWYTSGTSASPWDISHAVSDDGFFFTKDPRNPIIRTKTSSDWDYNLRAAHVIRVGKKFKMWYNPSGTKDGVNAWRIAYAEGTVDSSPTQIAPQVANRNPGSQIVFTHTGGVAPVTWVSSNSGIAAIDSTANKGRTAYVTTGLTYGTATITAEDVYGNMATAEVVVTPTNAPLQLDIQPAILRKGNISYTWELFEE